MILFDQGFEKVLGSVPAASVEVYREALESFRFPGESHSLLMRNYLKQKYARLKLDVIVAFTDTALEFLLTNREELFPNVPIVYVVSQRFKPGTQPPDSTGIWVGPNIKETLEVALQLQPQTQQVFVISGPTNSNQSVEIETRDQLAGFEQRVKLNYLVGLPLDELTEKVKNLPAQSIVLYQRQTRGTAGRSLVARDALAMIAAAANAPIYSTFDAFVGAGTVGGLVISHEALGARAAELALKIANGARVGDIPEETAVPIPMFDGRQLKRWHISESSLPSGSDVRFRQLSFWEQYKWRIIAVAALVVLQSLLIAVLLMQRSKRARAEKSRRVSEENLQKLSGRLITLQDEEQRRIARELHDGLGQSLSMICNRATLCIEDTSEPAVRQQLEEISAIAVSTINEVRGIAHDLRPFELDRLGLVAAVDSMLEKVSEATSIRFSSDLDNIDGLLSPSAETSVYRIVQEGLNNLVKHARATEASVGIKRVQSDIVVSIADNGRGINSQNSQTNGNENRGFGLQGIAERVRMLGGVYSLDSKLGHGTTITVRLGVNRE